MTEDPTSIRVRITNREHPHYSETGFLTGNVISVLGTPMAEVRLEHCRHGTDGCFAKQGDLARDTLQPVPHRRRA